MQTRFSKAASASLQQVVKVFREWDSAASKLAKKYYRTAAAIRLEEGRGERMRRKWQDKIQGLRAEAHQLGSIATATQISELHHKHKEGGSIALAVLRKRKAKKKAKTELNIKPNYGREKKKKQENVMNLCSDVIHSSIDSRPAYYDIHGSLAIYSVDGQHPSLND